MEKSVNRRRRGRRKVDYDDVTPSTDLPPLVEGELRCFLFVTIGKLVWGSTVSSKAPPVSPAYIRLRWWGEASDGTIFRAENMRNNNPIKSRGRFCIRSGPKQIAAYFNDMGSATFDVLSSPKSLPIGRVQVPGVSALSTECPIRGHFPVISASSRKLGELQVSMSFKSIRGAYDETSDTATDASISSSLSRSRASFGGRKSRSRASSIGSVRSRSSSRGSYSGGRRGRSNSSSSKNKRTSQANGRRRSSRSRSNDSRASVGSRHSKTRNSSDVEEHLSNIPTPRGIDDLLEQNGHDLYNLRRDKSKSKENHVEIKTTVSSSLPADNAHYDVISDLLNRGKRLRDEISHSAMITESNLQTSPARRSDLPRVSHSEQILPVPVPIQHPTTNFRSYPKPTPEVDLSLLPQNMPPSAPAVQRHKSDTEMRIVDMVLNAKGIRTEDTMNSVDMSTLSSPLGGSIVSEMEDPLHDDSILQHLFYNHVGFQNNHPKSAAELSVSSDVNKHEEADKNFPPTRETDQHRDEAPSNKQKKKLQQKPPMSVTGYHEEKLALLGKIHLARLTVQALQLTSSEFDSEINTSQPAKNAPKWKKAKPAAPSSPRKNSGTFFVEYKFPASTTIQRPGATTSSSHDLTRVVSRKSTPGGLVKFEQHSVFPIRFNTATLTRWCDDVLEFVIYHRKPKDKKPSIIGVAILPLRLTIDNKELRVSAALDVKLRNENRPSKIIGSLKVCLELTSDSKDLPTQLSLVKKPTSLDETNPYTVTKPMTGDTNHSGTEVVKDKFILRKVTTNHNNPRVCVAPDLCMSSEEDVNPTIASTILYLYIFLKEARDIPATRQCGNECGKSCSPNVYLVCRSFASDDASKTAVVWSTSNPKFGFSQVTPVKIDGHLFSRMRDNYMVVEVWTKIPNGNTFSDKLMGLVKISLNVFYQSLKDPEIARAVLTSQYPLISVDGFQPIVDLFSGHARGKLQMVLALGTQTQINALRKMQDEGRMHRNDEHHFGKHEKAVDVDRRDSGYVQHVFEINIREMRGFKPQSNQVWGETDCFIQYNFPTQGKTKEESDDSYDDSNTDDESSDIAKMRSYRTETTLCIPDPKFDFTHRHIFHPPPSVPVQRILLSTCSGVGKYPGGGIPFEVWSRFYYPNVRDQLLAKGSLPAAKLCSLVAMKKGRVAEQAFHVPLKFVDPEPGSTFAGDLAVFVKYKASGSTLEANKPPMQFCKNVKLQVGVLRACGLQAAAKSASSLLKDSDLQYCSEVGVNSYAVVKASFLPDRDQRETRCIARSFAPDYNHHFEMSCPVVTYHDSVTPISLAELFASGEIEIDIWHKPTPEEDSRKPELTKDILLGRVKVLTCDLLTRTTGCSGWYPVTSLESLQHNSLTTVGAIELSLSLSNRNDLELILRAARSVGWKPDAASELNRLLVPDATGILKPVDDAIVKEGHVTSCITITNVWLPKKILVHPGLDEIDKSANIYIRYKFYDKDSITSSLCPVLGHGNKKPHKKDQIVPVKLAHRKSFLCKPTQPFVWYLREELLELQIWLSHSRSGKSNKRPFDSDKLIGAAQIDMSAVLVGGLHKQQHISGLFHLFKAGMSDLGEAAVRVYMSLTPGDHTRPCDFDSMDDTSHTLSSSTENFPHHLLSTTQSNENLENDDGGEIAVKEVEQTVDDANIFLAIVSVERAMHLPPFSPLTSSSEAHGTKSSQRPSCYVSYPVEESKESSVMLTNVVVQSSCPVWEDAKEVRLPRKLLHKGGGNLLFRVWNRISDDKKANDDASPSNHFDRMIGFVTVDLTILSAGFRAVNGWYNILDIHGNCQGQMKVAVTPSTAIAPSTSQNPDSSILHVSNLTAALKGAMHSVPLFAPVVTPSGSMYYPGVASSQQTVGTTCKMSENVSTVTQSFVPSTTAAVKESSVNIAAVPAMPSRTMFGHDQKTCLLDTLQRQMKELDEIKQNFAQKRMTANYFIECDAPVTTAAYLSPAATPVVSISSIVSDTSTPSSYLLSDGPAVTTTLASTAKRRNAPDFSSQPQPSAHSTEDINPVASGSKKTVHMSLLRTGKNNFQDYEDGAALSDNDLSDVEFVCPRNLNTQSGIFPDVVGDEQDGSFLQDHPPKISEFGKSDEEADSSAGSIQVNQSDASELNNTSLWLSASNTTRMGEVTEDEEEFTPSETVGSDPVDTNLTIVKVRREDIVEKDPHHLREDGGSSSSTLSAHKDEVPSKLDDHEDDSEETNSSKDLHEDDLFDERNEDEENVASDHDANNHFVEKPSGGIDREVEDDSLDEDIYEEESDQKHLEDKEPVENDKDQDENVQKEQDNDHVDIHSPNTSINSANAAEEDGDLEKNCRSIVSSLCDEEADWTNNKSLSPASSTTYPKFVASDNEDAVPSTSSADARDKPSSSAPHSSSRKLQVANFFPPRQDLVASMEALKSLNEQQQKSLKTDSVQNEDSEQNMTSPPRRKSARKLTKPSSFTKEQTQRLARIFNTKYASG